VERFVERFVDNLLAKAMAHCLKLREGQKSRFPKNRVLIQNHAFRYFSCYPLSRDSIVCAEPIENVDPTARI
jgi:hypothetical protein